MPGNRSIEQLIDEQVNRWRLLFYRSRPATPEYVPVVNISREAGTQGKEVARRIAEGLNVPLFDREIIERVAKDARKATSVIESLDERGRIALDEWFVLTVSSRHITPDQFMEHLMKVVGAIGRRGSAVILGRGAGFILPPNECFRVRCVAPLEVRVHNWAREKDVTEEEAQRQVTEEDADRRVFVERNFRVDVQDPDLYDLVLNMEKIDPAAAADTVLFTMERAGLIPARHSGVAKAT